MSKPSAKKARAKTKKPTGFIIEYREDQYFFFIRDSGNPLFTFRRRSAHIFDDRAEAKATVEIIDKWGYDVSHIRIIPVTERDD